MRRILFSVFFVSILLTLFFGFHSLFGQYEKNKSRLNIKRNQSAYIPKLPILLAKRNFKVNTTLETNVDIKSNNYISQFLKSSFVSNSVVKSENQTDKKIFNEFENDNYLFANDKIVVSNLYPNPANDYVDIDYQISGSFAEAKISLYNILGQEVKELVLEKDQRNLRLYLKELNNGLYIYQLIVDGRALASKKLILRRG